MRKAALIPYADYLELIGLSFNSLPNANTKLQRRKMAPKRSQKKKKMPSKKSHKKSKKSKTRATKRQVTKQKVKRYARGKAMMTMTQDTV